MNPDEIELCHQVFVPGNRINFNKLDPDSCWWRWWAGTSHTQKRQQRQEIITLTDCGCSVRGIMEGNRKTCSYWNTEGRTPSLSLSVLPCPRPLWPPPPAWCQFTSQFRRQVPQFLFVSPHPSWSSFRLQIKGPGEGMRGQWKLIYLIDQEVQERRTQGVSASHQAFNDSSGCVGFN